MRARRACLSVPASSLKFITKATQLKVDEIFFDLEDSVAPSEKAAARHNVAQALPQMTFASPSVGLRINGLHTPFFYQDMTGLVAEVGAHLHSLIIPKVESADEVRFLDRLLTLIEAEKGIAPLALELQIETAKGLRHVFEIVSASPRIENLTFGPADMGASLGLPTVTAGAPLPGYEGLDHFHYVFLQLNVAAKSQGVQAIDGPYLQIRDLVGLRQAALRARALGFDGKWALHPDQVAVIQEVFTPTEEEVSHAKELLSHYQKAQKEQHRGAVMFGREMIDEASRKQAERIIARQKG
jgi:citrate lyase subunit beta / citryl-CoA lyase